MGAAERGAPQSLLFARCYPSYIKLMEPALHLDLEAKLRPEPHLPGKWGIYSRRSERWMEVVFASEREAIESIAIIAGRNGQILAHRQTFWEPTS